MGCLSPWGNYHTSDVLRSFGTPQHLWVLDSDSNITRFFAVCPRKGHRPPRSQLKPEVRRLSAEFAPPAPLSDTYSIPQDVLLTKDDPPIVKVADFGLAKAVDSFSMLRVRSIARCLFAQSTISDLYRADDVWDTQLPRA